jgi:hypothetical protein
MSFPNLVILYAAQAKGASGPLSQIGGSTRVCEEQLFLTEKLRSHLTRAPALL